MSDIKPVWYCDKCGKVLKDNQIYWLELNMKTNTYHEPGTVPKDESQGGFPFGKNCAKQILRNGGTW